jgi:hypothetical protein
MKRPHWLSSVLLCGLAALVTIMPLLVRSMWPVSRASGGAPATQLPQGTLGERVQVGDVFVLLSIPSGQPRVGLNEIMAVLTDAAGQPISDAKVTFDIDMTNMSHGLYLVDCQCTGSGHFAANADFSMAGPWRVHVLIEKPGQPTAKARFTFAVDGA